MNPSQENLAFYTQLASWWPMISPPHEYEEEAAFSATLLRTARLPVKDVLELGSGGGHNALHLKAHFNLTLVDLSAQMLAMSLQLNPECTHLQGDMRHVRLDRMFDAVFVHDAVDYMTSEQDLRLALRTAFLHCRPGGVAVFIPDQIRETFTPGYDCGGTDGPDGRGVRYLEWTWDPDPADSRVQTEYSFLLREADGTVRSVHETHHLGVFSREDWLTWLNQTGFEAQVMTEVTSEDRAPREVFLGHRLLP